MRAALLCCGLLALTVMRIGGGQEISGQDREIPRFVLLGDSWVCVDRNPAQVNRQDCRPRPRVGGDRRK